MTTLLFRQHGQASTFTANVLETDGQAVRLNRTLFYPEGGGQSADQGALRWAGGQVRVTDVQKRGGEVWHSVEGDPPPIGTVIEGHIDWDRRYRHMQRHSAEHLLAQAFLRVNPAFQVRSVSMRSPHCTLDLAGDPGPADARAAEDIVRQIIRRDLPIRAFEVPDTELDRYPLRRPATVRGQVRLVGVQEDSGWWELVACGGTHLEHTALVAPVMVTGLEHLRGLTRVSFMAGEEASTYLGEVLRDAQQVAQRLSVPVERLNERVQATLDTQTALEQALDTAHSGWATSLIAAAPTVPAGTVALKLLSLPRPELITLALKAGLQQPGQLTVVLTPQGRVGVASSAADRPAGSLLRAWLAESGGKGGGKADTAQGQADDPETFRNTVLRWAETV